MGLCITAIIARVAISLAASSSAVDQYYWNLAAKAYRDQRVLPVRIVGKYLMESEEQAYPPLFGILLGRLQNLGLHKHATLLIELAEVLMLAGLMGIIGLPWSGILLACAFYLSAPILVIYNSQLTPRILGDFFLFFAMGLQVIATLSDVSTIIQMCLWVMSSVALAMMFMSHKMTYQLHFVLIVFWAFALKSLEVIFATFGGIFLYLIFLGIGFAKLQLRAHMEIVCFWARNWKNLEAHQFNSSHLYGGGHLLAGHRFHLFGWPGIRKHVLNVIGYSPAAVFLPICSFVSGILPPDWVLIWFGVTYAWVFLTLFISPLKCLGGGHLYVFNAIAPCALYIAYLPQTPQVFLCLAGATILTVIALLIGLHTVKNRPTSRSKDFDQALKSLQSQPQSRVAVFPLQAAEPVAALTKHAVLWGGHGLDFHLLEGFFPVLSKPINEFFKKYQIEWVLWDTEYWPNGLLVISTECKISRHEPTKSFGKWRLLRLNVT